MEKAGHLILLWPKSDASFIISTNATCVTVSPLLPSFWVARTGSESGRKARPEDLKGSSLATVSQAAVSGSQTQRGSKPT